MITYDFLQDATTDGRALRILTVTDEFTRESWAIAVARSFPACRVIEVLAKAFAEWGTPRFVRSDNGPEFIAQAVVAWLYRQGIDTHHIDPGSPWQNPFAEAFHSRFRDECLDQESFAGLLEAQVICEHYANITIAAGCTAVWAISHRWSSMSSGAWLIQVNPSQRVPRWP